MNSQQKKWLRIALSITLLILIAAIVYIKTSQEKESVIGSVKTPATSIAASDKPSSLDRKLLPKVVNVDENKNPYDEELLKAQIMQATDHYIEASKYPNFSQPISHPDQAREYEPYELSEVDTPFPNGDDQAVRLQVAVDKYQYFAGDVITARLRVLGAPTDAYIAATAAIDTPRSAGNSISEVDMQASGTANEFLATFDSRMVAASLFAPEMLLKVFVQIDERELFTTTSFKFNQASANLMAIPYARPESEFLNIALQYDVYRPGYYFVSAILADEKTGRALIKLQNEGHMPLGNAVLNLRAHIQALKLVESEGPYVLRNIQTYRGAERGDAGDAPASSSNSSYAIPGYSFEQYDDVAHQDELTAQRIEFLEDIGSVENED